jgi:hypothetical protein
MKHVIENNVRLNIAKYILGAVSGDKPMAAETKLPIESATKPPE